MNILRQAIRAVETLILFAFFGIGAVLLAPAALFLRDVRYCTFMIRMAWMPFVRLFEIAGLIKIDISRLMDIRGSVIAANHPSLIDVVILIAVIPRTLFVAKHGLKKNPFVSVLVKNASLPDDESLVKVAGKYLKDGWNVLIFPEGTRSPDGGGLQQFRRGAAQLAIRTGSPLVPVAIRLSPFRILGKHQQPWDMGSEKVTYEFIARSPIKIETVEGEPLHGMAKRVTEKLRDDIVALL